MVGSGAVVEAFALRGFRFRLFGTGLEPGELSGSRVNSIAVFASSPLRVGGCRKLRHGTAEGVSAVAVISDSLVNNSHVPTDNAIASSDLFPDSIPDG